MINLCVSYEEIIDVAKLPFYTNTKFAKYTQAVNQITTVGMVPITYTVTRKFRNYNRWHSYFSSLNSFERKDHLDVIEY